MAFYPFGTRFRLSGLSQTSDGDFMLVRPQLEYACLVRIDNGRAWGKQVNVEGWDGVNSQELKVLMGDTLVSYFKLLKKKES